jgi:Fe2+ or Zn2+ uptake regulation protein
MPSDPDQELITLLRARGQRVTPQRLVIHRELRRRERHLSAEEVHEAVAERLPGVSLPTVYATLELLSELGLARHVHAASGAALYDGRREPHHHTVCRACGRVEDLDPGLDLGPILRAARREGFAATGAEVVVDGLCAECAARP